MSPFKIGIIGSGKMGTDIFNYLQNYDLKIVWVLSRSAEKDRTTAKFLRKQTRALQSDLISQHTFDKKVESVIISQNLESLKDCSLIIESITEDISEKLDLFSKLDHIVNSSCIFTSNSSSIRPDSMLDCVGRTDKFINLHFFYPLKFTGITEIIITEATSYDTVTHVKNFLKYINKHYLLQNRDSAFLLNRFLMELQVQAYKIFIETDISIPELDCRIKNRFLPNGLFEVMDDVGLDTIAHSIRRYTENENENDRYGPLLNGLDTMLKLNRLGKKNKKGFYSYAGDDYDVNGLKNKETVQFNKSHEDEIVNAYISKARHFVDHGYCSEDKFDFSVRQFLNTENGPFSLTKSFSFNPILLTPIT